MSRQPVDCRSVEALISALRSGPKARFLLFWGHRAQVPGRLDNACLSQWWPAQFTTEGQTFGSAEHYLMWRKAELFDDRARAKAILAARSPAEAKTIGRAVAGFDEATWVAHRWDIVVAASMAKFGADPALRRFLVDTGKRVLVEASPRDRVWGIGLGAEHEFAEIPQKWRGLNLLGFALMEARARLSRRTRPAELGTSH